MKYRKFNGLLVKFFVIFSSLLSIIYVIPLYHIIGDTGGVLYGCFLTVLRMFMAFSGGAFSFAVNKLVNEYQVDGYNEAKKRVFIIGKKIALFLGFIFCVFTFVSAPLLGKMIFGDWLNSDVFNDRVFVIRVSSIVMLFLPLLSVYRGYLEGHRISESVMFSKCLEKVINISFILVGSFILLYLGKFSLRDSFCGVFACFAISSIIVFVYLQYIVVHNKKRLNDQIRKVNQPIITNKVIVRKLLSYLVPIVFIEVFKVLYNFIDMTTVFKGLTQYAGFSIVDADIVLGMLLIWGDHFNLFIVMIAIMIITKIMPNLLQVGKKINNKELGIKLNYMLSCLLLVIIPVTILMSFLSEPIWMLFYGNSKYGASLLAYYIFVGLLSAILFVFIMLIFNLKDYKTLYISLIIGILIKCFMNNSMIYTFHQYGLPGYYGVITVSLLAYIVPIIIMMLVLHNKYRIDFEESVKTFMDSLCGSMLMIIGLFLLKFIIPMISSVRFVNLFIIVFYLLIGVIIYCVFCSKIGIIKHVLKLKEQDNDFM